MNHATTDARAVAIRFVRRRRANAGKMGLFMPFPWTLQRYIFREMGKTFVLTAVAMTAVLGLGGGVLNMIKLGEVTTAQLFRLMMLILPVAAALTLPVAALFSAASTYGRMSSDNEFVACRASGINMHVLFLPPVVLSLASAAITFLFTSFLIPGMARNLNEFVTADFSTMVEQRLKRPRGITLGGKYRIYADTARVDLGTADRVALDGIAFIEVDGEEWVRFGTARSIDLRFERLESNVRVAAELIGLTFYDRTKGQFADLGRQIVPPSELPPLFAQKLKFQNMIDLMRYRRKPEMWREVSEAVDRVRTRVGCREIYDSIAADFADDKEVTLVDSSTRLVLRAEGAARIPRDGGIELTEVAIEEDVNGRWRTGHAERAVIEVALGDALAQLVLRVDVHDVRFSLEGRAIERAKDTLGPIAVSESVLKRVRAIPAADLLDAFDPSADSDAIAEARGDAIAVRSETVRRIVATLHERAAFSVSVFVLVVLGAVLGIVFRGSQAVVAFGISFIPSLLVIVTIVMGKQMAQNEATPILGLVVLWGGIVAVALLDGWTLTRVLRR